MSISLRVTPEELNIIKNYADLQGTSVSETIRKVIFEKIENDFDIKVFEKGMKEYKSGAKRTTHEDLLKELGLDE